MAVPSQAGLGRRDDLPFRTRIIEAGFARIDAALPSLGDGPQFETSELLVFQR
jgi:hypothetical protein